MSFAFGKNTARQRRLGVVLRRLRKAAGLSGPTLAHRLGVSQSHLSRVELGEAVATIELVERWTVETGASQADREIATDLADLVAGEVVTRREAIASGLAKRQREALAAEAASTTVIAYVPALIPGLMQTADYATQLVSGNHPDYDDIAEAVAVRMQRQVVLYSRTKTLRWVIGEAGLRWRVGPPEVMAAQLDRLAALAAEPHLDVRVLPFERTGPVWHDHGFTILADRTDGEPDLVGLEMLTGWVNITDPAEVAQYRAVYERLADLALRGAEALPLIHRVRAEFLD
ncbi:MAG TPA: helix-turn-helix transcriptional regulator [Pseudonocardiaceae bacterium]|nr:helix-turn-helix transcriptional regulator [Pseudonocardiaceae bacterium]